MHLLYKVYKLLSIKKSIKLQYFILKYLKYRINHHLLSKIFVSGQAIDIWGIYGKSLSVL